MDAPDPLLQQADRLKFLDPTLERKFCDERVEQAQLRSRMMIALAMVVVAGFGLQEVLALAESKPQFAAVSFWARTTVVLPIYAVLMACTWLPGHARRADWLFTLGITAVVWALALIKWHATDYFAWVNVSAVLLLDVLATLIMSVLALPLRFRAVLVLAGAGTGGVALLFALTVLRGNSHLQQQLVVTLVGFAAIAVLLQWFRERAERRLFAQHENLVRLNDELAYLNEEKNAFMEIAAHDLRTPLAVVKGYVEMLEEDSSSDRRTQGIHRAIKAQANCMLALVNNYLGAQAMAHAALPLSLQPLDLGKVARRALTQAMPRARAKQQTLLIPDERSGVGVWADPLLLQQVVDNLLSNALKFSPPGSQVSLCLSQEEDRMNRGRLTVVDAGPGIPEAEHDRIFRRFGRTSVRPTGDESSHGLGLALVKNLAERMNGEVGFSSVLGQGSRFWIELKSAECPDDDGLHEEALLTEWEREDVDSGPLSRTS